jgi:hypothetical protein
VEGEEGEASFIKDECGSCGCLWVACVGSMPRLVFRSDLLKLLRRIERHAQDGQGETKRVVTRIYIHLNPYYLHLTTNTIV